MQNYKPLFQPKPLNNYTALKGILESLQLYSAVLNLPHVKILSNGIYSVDPNDTDHIANCHNNLKRYRDAFVNGMLPEPSDLTENESLDYAYLNQISADIFDLSSNVFDDTDQRRIDTDSMIAKPRNMKEFVKEFVVLELFLSQIEKTRQRFNLAQ